MFSCGLTFFGALNRRLLVNKKLLLHPAMALNIFAKELRTGKHMRVKVIFFFSLYTALLEFMANDKTHV